MLTINIGSCGSQLLVSCSCGASAGYNGFSLDLNPLTESQVESTPTRAPHSLGPQTSSNSMLTRNSRNTLAITSSHTGPPIKQESLDQTQAKNSVGTWTGPTRAKRDKATNSSPIQTSSKHTATDPIKMLNKSTYRNAGAPPKVTNKASNSNSPTNSQKKGPTKAQKKKAKILEEQQRNNNALAKKDTNLKPKPKCKINPKPKPKFVPKLKRKSNTSASGHENEPQTTTASERASSEETCLNKNNKGAATSQKKAPKKTKKQQALPLKNQIQMDNFADGFIHITHRAEIARRAELIAEAVPFRLPYSDN